jgi:hypothetical protein
MQMHAAWWGSQGKCLMFDIAGAEAVILRTCCPVLILQHSAMRAPLEQRACTMVALVEWPLFFKL